MKREDISKIFEGATDEHQRVEHQQRLEGKKKVERDNYRSSKRQPNSLEGVDVVARKIPR